MKRTKLPDKIETYIIYAKNGLKAVQKYKEMVGSQFGFHMIFMDLHMDVMDGEEATKRIRSYE